MNVAAAQAPVNLPVPELIPLVIIALVLFALFKWGRAPAWALILALLIGVVLSGTIAGPPIHQFLSQLSGGRLN